MKITTIFKLRNKPTWHIMAHTEYGVYWSECGIRVMKQDLITNEINDITEISKKEICRICTQRRDFV